MEETPLDSQKQQHWKKLRDNESGFDYYLNEETGESSWEVPDGFVESHSAAIEHPPIAAAASPSSSPESSNYTVESTAAKVVQHDETSLLDDKSDKVDRAVEIKDTVVKQLSATDEAVEEPNEESVISVIEPVELPKSNDSTIIANALAAEVDLKTTTTAEQPTKQTALQEQQPKENTTEKAPEISLEVVVHETTREDQTAIETTTTSEVNTKDVSSPSSEKAGIVSAVETLSPIEKKTIVSLPKVKTLLPPESVSPIRKRDDHTIAKANAKLNDRFNCSIDISETEYMNAMTRLHQKKVANDAEFKKWTRKVKHDRYIEKKRRKQEVAAEKRQLLKERKMRQETSRQHIKKTQATIRLRQLKAKQVKLRRLHTVALVDEAKAAAAMLRQRAEEEQFMKHLASLRSANTVAANKSYNEWKRRKKKAHKISKRNVIDLQGAII